MTIKKLSAVYDSMDDIPEPVRGLYSERDGKFELSGIEGIKTAGDVSRVQEALRKSSADQKALKAQLERFGGLEADEIRANLDELEVLRLKGGGDGKEVESMVSARLRQQMAPVERARDKHKRDHEEAIARLAELEASAGRTKILTAAHRAARGKVSDQFLDDVEMYAERYLALADDGAVVTKDGGLDPEAWLDGILAHKPAWRPESHGGGAPGGRAGGGSDMADNPFLKGAANGISRQMLLHSTDPAKAARLKAQAEASNK